MIDIITNTITELNSMFLIITLISSLFLSVLIAFYFKHYRSNYLVCPYCKKSVLAFYDWQCEHCYHTQGKNSVITDKCNECGRKLETLICEYCDKEFKI